MKTRLLLAVMTVMALAACGEGEPYDADEEAGAEVEVQQAELRARAKVRVSATDQPPRWKKRFKIDATHTLFFGADVAAGPGPHVVAFEVFAPGGSLYQRNEVGCTGASQVLDAMPVSGTWIQQYAMTGQWQVQVFIDQAAQPSGKASFELK